MPMPEADAIALDHATGRLIVEIFRLNGRLLQAGDELVAPLGLTSARWQVLWAMAISPVPLPVAHLARSMGLNRQGVQRLVNEMAAEGVVALEDNPNHKRARLVVFTQRGRQLYDSAEERRRPWLRTLSGGGSLRAIDDAIAVLRGLRERLGEASDPDRG